MRSEDLFRRYQELQAYVGWSDVDAQRVAVVGKVVRPEFTKLIDDFYEEIERHEATRRVITGGQRQIQRLKGTLIGWLDDLVSGVYDAGYVARRWRVGFRHVEIGLDQVFANAALSRLREGLDRALELNWKDDAAELTQARRSLNRLLDLDLAIIEDAYQTAYRRRQQQIERLATIGQVAGGTAHELRNPLNVIKTSVYYLLNAKNASPEKITTHLERINRQVGSADDVITALNSFARLPTPELRPIAAPAFFQGVLADCVIPPDVRVTIDCPDDLPLILGDAKQLAIVLSNLVRNACDAMPGGGSLRLAARLEPDYLEISVADDGCGISAEHLDRVTEPLYSTKPRGIGLGLAIANAILEKHEAKLKITSRQGEGTTVAVRMTAFSKTRVVRRIFPARRRYLSEKATVSMNATNKDSVAKQGDASANQTAPPRILVVDDERDICENLRDIFGDLGYEVDMAFDGPSALRLVGEHRYDVALLDLKMPGMDGLELYRRIREIAADTVAILVTAHASATTAEDALSAGASGVISKPVDFQRLLGHVSRAIDQPVILLVDDDQELCHSLWDVLRGEGYRVAMAHSVDAARKQIDRATFETALVDLRLPDGAGADVLEVVQRSRRGTAVILITGHAPDSLEVIDELLRKGVGAVCHKPFDMPMLLETIRRLSSHRKSP